MVQIYRTFKVARILRKLWVRFLVKPFLFLIF